MKLPSYWMPRPEFSLESAIMKEFDNYYQKITHHPDQSIPYTPPVPKWQFFCYLTEQYSVVLHGSANVSISRFQPRQPDDLSAFGNQNAVYAASDGIWPMYFAILDRERYPMSMSNACIRLVQAGQISVPYYLFSITREALVRKPWRDGMMYILPNNTFVSEPSMQVEDAEVRSAQVASLVPVDALARVAISPEDFPFLEQIRGHDDARLQEYVTAMQTGAEWPDGDP